MKIINSVFGERDHFLKYFEDIIIKIKMKTFKTDILYYMLIILSV